MSTPLDRAAEAVAINRDTEFDLVAGVQEEDVSDAHASLDAALDVDELARVLWEHDTAPDTTPEWREMAWADMGGAEPSEERIGYELRAAAVRDHLLGGDDQ